jgi:hypothetical protein
MLRMNSIIYMYNIFKNCYIKRNEMGLENILNIYKNITIVFIAIL